MKLIFKFVAFLSLFFIIASCSNNNQNDTSDLYAKSQAVDEIIKRSGNVFATNSPEKRDKALDDAQNRLQTGGGLLGKKPGGLGGMFGGGDSNNSSVASIGFPINAILWKSSLETISFMPIASADPFAGIIITDWYSTSSNSQERCKLNIFIKGVELKTNNLKVNTFCQDLNDGVWVNSGDMQANSRKIENAILNKAKKIKLSLN